MIAFWLIVAVFVGFTAYAIVSPRRNPPMRKCFACKGDGVVYAEFVFGPVVQICAGCDGEGWVTSS